MSKVNQPFITFNRGIASPLVLARTDIKRVNESAETQKNFISRTLGSMMLRPGLQYIGQNKSGLNAKYIPFVFAADDTALLELTPGVMRVWVDDVLVTRPSVSATITNEEFTSDLTGWTDNDQAGTTSSWVSGTMSLVGTRFNAAERYQTVVLGGGDSGKVHAIRIGVFTGEIMLHIGSTVGGYEILGEQKLAAGDHSIAFVPTVNFTIHISSNTPYQTLITHVRLETAGTLEIPTPWDADDLLDLRFDQSGDVVFVACSGEIPRKIERRNNNSWSVVEYFPLDGPFRLTNSEPIFIETDGTDGTINLTANHAIFTAGNEGGLFRLESIGQTVTNSLAGEDQFTNSIVVSGFGEDERSFTYDISGTWTGEVTLQRSVGVPDAWVDVLDETANASATYYDELDDQTVYYRIGIKAGDYGSGTAVVALAFDRGSITGIVRILGATSSSTAGAQVIKPLGSTLGTQIWAEGAWSNRRGWPSAVSLFEGRLWWAGMDRLWGSVSDAFSSFDDTIEGDSGTIARSIGAGPVERIQWLLPLQRLIAGGQAAEFSVRSSSFDEPVTPTNFSIKPASTQGSADIAAVRIDSDGVFVQRGTARVYRLAFSDQYYDYSATDLTVLTPELCSAGIIAIAVQRQPDTRIHCVLADGTVAVHVYDREEKLSCWNTVEMTTDDVVDVVVLPTETMEDDVYYEVNIGGSYYLTKWAQESECQGGQLNKQADVFVSYTGVAISSLAVGTHLNGRTVVIWADGADRGTAVVSGGNAALGGSYTNVVVGLPYTAQYKSTKLAYGEELGTSLTQRKRVAQVGLLLRNTHYQGIKFGPDFTLLDSMPLIHEAATTAAHTIHSTFDSDPIEFPGEWGTDPRLCLQAAAPRPCTVLGAVLIMETQEGFMDRRSAA